MNKLLNEMITFGLKQGATDIYIKENGSFAIKDFKGMLITKRKIDTKTFDILMEDLLTQSELLNSKNILLKGERFLFGKTLKLDKEEILISGQTVSTIRIRGQLINELNGRSLTIRLFLSSKISYKELTKYSGITDEISKILNLRQGLIICIGGTGQGKSTLVTSLIQDMIDRDLEKNLVTIEEPIEYIFNQKECVKKSIYRTTFINQIEVGTHLKSYEEAILSTTRDDSDIVYIQEISTKESALALKKILNSGKLVIITLHASRVTQAIGKLLILMREFSGDDNFNKELLSQESICILGQNLIKGYKLDDKGERQKDQNGNYIMKPYGVQEFLQLGPIERNLITSGEQGEQNNFEKKLNQRLYDKSTKNRSLNDILLELYLKDIIDANIFMSKSNDLLSLRSLLKENVGKIGKKKDYEILKTFTQK